jgi:hypothetical protein
MTNLTTSQVDAILAELSKLSQDFFKHRTTRRLGPVAYERRCQRNWKLRRQLAENGWTAEEIYNAIHKA